VREARQQGSARAAGKSGVTRGEGKQEVDDGGLLSGGRRGGLHRRQSRSRAGEQRAEGVQRKKKRGKVQGLVWNT
jgi:hypothetical protein